ncbi:MAG: SMP-30/gluconolactonase/LRE family protein [Defluviitaleaceae bacterium]|nr:SMP-30/gluconolactonase/LRE family protein [Defluviitaleaceae bacterium]
MKIYSSAPISGTEAILGEGPLWNVKEQKLYWVDIDGKQLHVYDPKSKTDRAFDTPGRIGVAAFCKDGRILCAVEDTLMFMKFQNASYEADGVLAKVSEVMPGMRFNDGECDPRGRFLVGSIAGDKKGHLFSVDSTGMYQILLDGIGCSNGIAFSCDGKKMYYIDTVSSHVTSYDYCLDTGKISAKKIIRTFAWETDGAPDGMTIDTKGNLWVAHWGGSRVSCINPEDGEIIASIPVTAKCVTSAAFGGPELKTIYITSAKADGGIHAGGLFAADADVSGNAPYLFG